MSEDNLKNKKKIILSAKNLTLKYEGQIIFENISHKFSEKEFHIVTSEPSQGRTSFLLALAGRMKITSGKVDAYSISSPRKIQKVVSIAGFRNIDSIDHSVKVKDVLKERLRWIAPWWKFVWRITEKDIQEVCQPIFGSRPIPKINKFYGELSDLDALLLKIAFANLNQPKIIIIDDIEQVRADKERVFLAERLAELAKEKTIITTAINALPKGSPKYITHNLIHEISE